MRRAFHLATACLATLLLALPAAAQAAGPPLISATSFSGVTETSATLEAKLDPNGVLIKDAHFEFIPLAVYEEDGEQFGAGTLTTPAVELPFNVTGKGTLTAGSEIVTNLTTTNKGAFGAGETITATGEASGAIPPGTTIVKAEAGQLRLSAKATATFAAASLTATGPQPVSVTLGGLDPATGYVFRLHAKNAKASPEEADGPATTFYTFAAPPLFGPCPNDAYRTGARAPAGQPSSLLPDCRAYEQASPVNKDGGDALSSFFFAHAAATGAAVTFGSAFGVPGGSGAQRLPYFLASRGAGESGWSTTGLLPPVSIAEEGSFLTGFNPDLTRTYSMASRFSGSSRTIAFYELHSDGAPPTQIAPYTDLPIATVFTYAGASADGEEVVVEAPTALSASEGGPPIAGSAPRRSNVYAWDRSSGQLTLASRLNTLAATETALPKGAYAGSYAWSLGERFLGGNAENRYVTDIHAVSEEGAVFFTSLSDGRLFERINPSQAQSPLDGQGNCTDPALACTLDLSASRRAKPDPAGQAPAIFMGASEDGGRAFFLSSQKLTDDANTGPDQPEAQIGQLKIGASGPEDENEGLIATHALGLTFDPSGTHLYWVDPSGAKIGRATIDASGQVTQLDPSFISIPEAPLGECEEEVKIGKNETQFVPVAVPAHPRYVAVDSEYVYWTNTGRIEEGGLGFPLPGGGTIGRAKLEGGVAGDVEPAFICGEDPAEPGVRRVYDPQGIAVDAEHIYWANSPAESGIDRRVVRSALDGTAINTSFIIEPSLRVRGLAIDAGSLYFSAETGEGDAGFIRRVPLAGGESQNCTCDEGGVRGIALAGGYVYWVSQKRGAIARYPAASLQSGHNCYPQPEQNCEPEYFKSTGKLEGLAADPSGERLYFSVNGEAPRNPGSDLYRYEAGANPPLTDLTPDPADEDGAAVQGVLGSSTDGAYVYFAANGVLAGNTVDYGGGPLSAQPGDCKGPSVYFRLNHGHCNLYLYHAGQTTFVAPLQPSGVEPISDSDNWIGSPKGAYNCCSYTPRSARVSADGQTLIFRSIERLTDYENDGVPELYRYQASNGGLACVSCAPSGEAPRGEGPNIAGRLAYTGPNPADEGADRQIPRFLSADGRRAFFETTEALVSHDTNGAGGCPKVGSRLVSCSDVYEWEAPGAGTCTAGGPAYSPLNQGCLYLISDSSDAGPSIFLDASESGSDVFFLTRSRLVGQDDDSLFDAYDARVGGGLAAQNPPPEVRCEEEGCKPGPTPPPAFDAPPHFSGPPDPEPKPPKCKKGKKGKKGHCHKHHHKHRKHHHKRRTHR